MSDNAISGYRHKVAFFKTPGDLWMLKRTWPNVCLAIAPNYRLQNDIPGVECGGNVITRRFVGPLLRRYCDRIRSPNAGKSTTRRLICEGHAMGSTPDDIRKADGTRTDDTRADDTRTADDIRKADDARKTDIRKADDILGQCASGYQEVRCQGWPYARTGLPWHVGRVYSGDSLTADADRYTSTPVKERAQSLLTVDLLETKQVITSERIAVQQPKFHVQYDFPVFHKKINSHALTAPEKKDFGQVKHEPEIINNLKMAETGSNSNLRMHSRINHQNCLAACKMHPTALRSVPTVVKSSNLIIRRCVNNTPENGIGNSKADLECQTLGEAELCPGIQTPSDQSIVLHESKRVSKHSVSDPQAMFVKKNNALVNQSKSCSASRGDP